MDQNKVSSFRLFLCGICHRDGEVSLVQVIVEESPKWEMLTVGPERDKTALILWSGRKNTEAVKFDKHPLSQFRLI